MPIEEIFYIGPYKAIVQVLEVEELKMVRNVANLRNFETPKDDGDCDNDEEKRESQINKQSQKQQQHNHMINHAHLSIPQQEHTDALSDGT